MFLLSISRHFFSSSPFVSSLCLFYVCCLSICPFIFLSLSIYLSLLYGQFVLVFFRKRKALMRILKGFILLRKRHIGSRIKPDSCRRLGEPRVRIRIQIIVYARLRNCRCCLCLPCDQRRSKWTWGV